MKRLCTLLRQAVLDRLSPFGDSSMLQALDGVRKFRGIRPAGSAVSGTRLALLLVRGSGLCFLNRKQYEREKTQMKTRITATLLALGFSVGAIAQQQAPSFEEVDENGDGMITQEEAAQIEGVDFQSADENQDGQLDRQEYEQATQQQ